MEYVIQPGDTLFAIARRFDTTVQQILTANPQITNPDVIYPGQIIVIPIAGPTPPPAPPSPPSPRCPVLRLGDRGEAVNRLQTLLTIARFDPGPIDGIFGPRTQAALVAFQQSVRELEITGIADLETWVALGAECVTTPGTISYTVRPGDTLFIIATRFNTTIQGILEINPDITDPNLLFVGQVIKIPVS